ncbi:MAG: YkgJ family cysteine cluster protein [Thermofilaceae archaeon]
MVCIAGAPGLLRPPRGFFTSLLCLTCGACCRGTEMPLLLEDVERLERLGLKREDFAVEGEGFPRLRNVGGYCVFYDARSGRCRVYSARPIGCRLYPLVFDEERGVLLDPECPLADFFLRDCRELEEALRLLRRVLEGLRAEYGYRYSERLLEKSAEELLSRCRQLAALQPGSTAGFTHARGER